MLILPGNDISITGNLNPMNYLGGTDSEAIANQRAASRRDAILLEILNDPQIIFFVDFAQ